MQAEIAAQKKKGLTPIRKVGQKIMKLHSVVVEETMAGKR